MLVMNFLVKTIQLSKLRYYQIVCKWWRDNLARASPILKLSFPLCRKFYQYRQGLKIISAAALYLTMES